MADVEFDISLKNTGSTPQSLSLFSPVESASQSSNKYSFSTPYQATYPIGAVFTLIDDISTNSITLEAVSTMAEVIDLLNVLNAGTWILAFNDAINGNVFHLLSQRNPVSLSIDNTTYFGTWALVDTGSSFPDWDDIVFPDATTVVMGDNGQMQVSIDNGDTYSAVALPSSAGYTIYQISFVDANNGFACGNNGANSRVWGTIDGGQSWALINTFLTNLFTGLWMFDTLTGFAFRRNTLSQWTVASTADGCSSFTTVQVIGNNPGRIQFVDASNAFIYLNGVASALTMLKTVNGGALWSSVALPWAVAFTKTTTDGYAMDANNVWLVGQSGTVRYSSDGGTSWNDWDIATAQPILSVHALSLTDVWVGRQGRQVARTIDGGANWTSETFAVGGTGTAIRFRDQYMGVANDMATNIYKYS